MNKLSKIETTEVEFTYTDLANKYYDSSSEAANTNKQVALTLSARIFNFFDAWTQHSYDAWEKAGRPPRDYI
jgi:hypothetical protein|tara:strand:+ start:334 stop:549 length:216 start_codon:yes stop_codon:yes gene_type:complete